MIQIQINVEQQNNTFAVEIDTLFTLQSTQGEAILTELIYAELSEKLTGMVNVAVDELKKELSQSPTKGSSRKKS